METEIKNRRKSNPIVLALYFIFWAMILIVFFALYLNQREEHEALQARLNALQAEIDAAQAAKDQLEIQMTFFDSDAYMEILARRRGMVRPNEIIFRNIAE